MAISPAAAAAAAAKNFAKGLANTNLSLGLAPNVPITQTTQKAQETGKELTETKQTLTETKETLTTTQNNLNKANTNLNNANKQISNLQGQIEELKKNGGSFVKIDTYIPHKDSYKSVTDITVSGAGAFGSEEDGDYTDYSSANGVYRVTPETAENENPFERVYKHETANWYIHGYFEEEYEGGYWYIGTSPDSERLARSTSSNEQIQSGTYTFEDWDYGWEVEVTLAVNEVDVPEQPLVLTGRKSTGFDPDTWEFTWSDESESFLECGETPEPGMIFAASGNQLLFGYLYSDMDSKCLFHHSFSAPADVADSGQAFSFENNLKPSFTVVDRVRCATNIVAEDYTPDRYAQVEVTVPSDLFVERAYVMTNYCSLVDGYYRQSTTPGRFSSQSGSYNSENGGTGFFRYGAGENKLAPDARYNEYQAVRIKTLEELSLADTWCQWVCNIRKGQVEVWCNGELISTAPIPDRRDLNNRYISIGFFGGEQAGGSYVSDCYCYAGRALDMHEIKAMWKKFEKKREEFVPVNMPQVDDHTVLAISLNEGLLKDYSSHNHPIEHAPVYPLNAWYTYGLIVPGREGEAAWRFTYGYLKVTPQDNEFVLGSNWTIEFDVFFRDNAPWMKNNLLGFSDGLGLLIGYKHAFNFETDNGVWIGEGEAGFCIREAGGEWQMISENVGSKEWRHVKIVRNGTTVTCSIDGQSTGWTANVTSVASAAAGLPLRIGNAQGTDGNGGFKGYINNLVISNVAR